jgi:hypothetical protein
MNQNRRSEVSVYDEIQAERKAQDEQWGGPDHDDLYVVWDWSAFLRKFADKAHEEGDQEWIGDMRSWKPGSFSARRRRLVQIAALAVAEIESIDRNRMRARNQGNWSPTAAPLGHVVLLPPDINPDEEAARDDWRDSAPDAR